MSTSENDDLMSQMQSYREVAEVYNDLKHAIDELLAKHDGGTENMSDEEIEHYRDLARQRDEAFNEMRWLEQKLLGDDLMA